jgi:signal transduction histidine kinase
VIALSLVVVTCLLNLLLGAFVLLRNAKAKYSKLFFSMTVFTSLWALSNYVTNLHFGHDVTLNIIANRAAFLCAFLAILSGTLFTYSFPVARRITQAEKWLLSVAAVLLAVLSVTTLGAGTVGLEDGGLVFKAGSLTALYAAGLVAYIVLVAYNLWSAAHHERGAVKEQASLILFGFSFTGIFGILSNVIIPAATSNAWTTQLGPLLTIVLVGSITYAIVRHRLFDIRAVVARAVGYVLAILVFAALYGFIVFGIATYVFHVDISIGAQMFISAATGLAALMFPVLRSWFDKLTSRLFYQDGYDPQELHSQLNKVLVSSLDVKYLMMQSISVIQTALKPDFAVVGLKDGPDSQRIFASRKMDFKQEDIDKIRAATPRIRHKVLVTDYLDNPKQAEVKEILQRYDIAVLVRLAQNVRSGEEGFGYLALGGKKSGNPYTQSDTRVLDTVANELIIAIQNALHYEEIQKFNVVLQDRVDDATRKLRSTNEKLKALDETKDDFISMASHQLRTPLTSIKGYLSMVLEGDAGKINETQRKMLNQSFVSSQRMVYLIADLLNVSRLKTGKFIIEPTPTNLADMVSEELGQLVETAASREIELTFEKPKTFPDMMLDETKTRQVIMNFVDNAIYYTPAGGHIKVVLEDNPTSVELKVIDDGIGVPKSEQHHLFTKFYRANNAQKARPDGTGLGLFMAKKVILAQGGSIIFESREGKGSTFGFLFPKNHKPSAKPGEPFSVTEEKATAK